ncbi:MAG: hypothetical protein IK077_05815 [Thermoguttaceae bacterium]|nr:hypothetical protein [Thermoguttaceae bacterium]
MKTSFVFSGDLSLRETVRIVSEIADVFPIDVYMGTSVTDYKNWDCRYDLTYRQFRPNYVLYLTAQNASSKEIVECFDEFSEMTPKEQALTCAALIAYLDACREKEPQSSGETSSSSFQLVPSKLASPLSEAEKAVVLKSLEKERDSQSVAFPKIEDDDLNSKWERNLREEFGRFMRLPRVYDGVTARNACYDLYAYPQSTKESTLSVPYLFDDWTNESENLPLEILCGVVLVQASFDKAQLGDERLLKKYPEETERLQRNRQTERDVVAERFLKSRKSIPEGADGFLDSMCEGVVMSAFLKTQRVASRYRFPSSDKPISGNSSDKDVFVSEIVQKAIAALSKR